MKNLLLTTIAIFGLALFTNAQVPNYIPANGLVGWWPFNGNANDESGNGNNGMVNGAMLVEDRFGNDNKAYSFNGINNYIQLSSLFNGLEAGTSATYNCWSLKQPNNSGIMISQWTQSTPAGPIGLYYGLTSNNLIFGAMNGGENILSSEPVNSSELWNMYSVVYDANESVISNKFKFYQNGVVIPNLPFSVPSNFGNQSTISLIGARGVQASLGFIGDFFEGFIDDIGIWNRALTQQEIVNLYNVTNCSNNLTISPELNQLTTGSTANFIATTSDSNPSYVWQSDFGQGFQTLNNYGNYSGVNTNSLSISNVQLSEHNQPIRVISTSGECIDTSNVATINITDTCIVTINDTITTLISVTDTLVINTLITGITPPNNSNTIKVFPNPANSHITIDFGNFESMNGYTLTITNSVGQTVYTNPITEQSSYIDLSTWSGNGIYFVQIIDAQNNTIENRKIVLQ